MKQIDIFCLSVLIIMGITYAQAEVNDNAFMGYGTGFTGGSETTVSSANALKSAAKGSGGKKIIIKGKISDALIVCGSNKYFVGDGTAELEKVSFLIKDASNVTIQNLTMHLPYPGSVSGSDHDGDVIHIEGSGAKNIWIDHCDLSNEFEGVSKDTYDGLIDSKKGASNITISWNYIHDAWKTNLNGHSDKDENGNWNISMHHNIFNKVGSRIPSIRGGKAAVFNNYYLLIPKTCINSRLGAEVYCEKNFFDGVGTGKLEKPLGLGEGPIGACYSAKPGMYNVVDNYYTRCMGSQPTNSESTTDYKPPFMKENDMVIPVKDVPDVLMAKAGVRGKLKELVYPDDGISSIIQNFQTSMNHSISSAPALYNVLGIKIFNHPGSQKHIPNTIYIVKGEGKRVQLSK